ncbi:hypothetical protein BGZ80_011365 [Entomortierella chlamydospora]|uniref:Uncharacterized protein n=1 Tax=Entomortierella chlamydospora TaxID=101097 RepID=A0A9P6MUB2_9FUNG|nr:hypothetical protein BGZ80_011365 [Entomortierella chlamydospora]
MSPSFQSRMALAGIAGLAVLGSTLAPSADAAITFGASVDSPGSIVMGCLSAMVPTSSTTSGSTSLLDQYLVPGLVNLTQAGFNITSPTQIVLSVNGSLNNPFGSVSLPLGKVGVQVILDGMSLANITTSDLTLPGGTGPLNVSATIDIADGNTNPAMKTSITNLVYGLFGTSTSNGTTSDLVISDLTLSGVSLGIQPITIPTTPILSANVSLSDLISSTSSTNSTSESVVGVSGLYNSSIGFTSPTITKLTIKAVSGAQLTAGVGFTWENPLNVNVDIPYVSVDLGLNGTRIATIGVEGLHLSPGTMSGEILVDLQFNNDAVASAQLGALINGFFDGSLNQIVNIGNLTIGAEGNTTATGILLNNLFSGIEIDLPLLDISTAFYAQILLGYIAPSLPIDISNLSSSGSSLSSYLKNLAISTAAGHTLLIEPKIQLPLDFELDLDIPYLALDINLEDNLLGELFLANLMGSGSGEVDISVGIGIVFSEPAPEIPPIVAKIVNGLTTGSSLDVLVGVSNLAIGVSPSDAINTLNNINMAASISDFITGSLSIGGSDVASETSVTVASNAIAVKIGSLVSLTIHEASISVLPNNLVSVGINLDMFLGIPVAANIGYFGVQLSLDGINLAGVDLTSGLNYAGGTAEMEMNIAILVGTGSDISGKVASLVNAIIANQTISSSLGIGRIVIGQSSSDLIKALSDLSFSVSLDGLSGSSTSSLSTSSLDSLITQLGLSVSDLSLATISDAGLQIGAKASFSDPIPLSLSVPFIGVSGGLDNVDIANVGLNNLAMAPGANAIQTQVDLNFNNAAEAQTKVATFVGEIVGGQLGSTPEALTVHNLRIGASASDYFDILSQIDVSIPSKDILTQANVNSLLSKLGLNTTQASGDLLSNLHLGAISVNLNNAPVIELGTSITVSNISLNAAVNIGYFGFDVALDADALAYIDVPSITISTANSQLSLAIKAAITVQDTTQIETDIANLVNYFTANTTTSPVNDLVISKPLLGVSTSDNIQTFSLITVSIPLSSLLVEAKAYVAKMLSGLGGMSTSSLSLSGIVVDLNSPSTINLQGGVSIASLTLPADISISYVGASIALDSIPLASVTIPMLNLTSANNALSVNFQALIDLQEGQDASAQVAKLVGSLLYPGQVKFSITLAPYLEQIGTLLSGTTSGSNLLSDLDIGSLVIDLNSPQTIGIDAAISIKNVTIPAEIKLNYVGINVAIGAVGLANIAVPSFTLASSNGALAITAHVDVTLLPSDDLTTAITSLVTDVLSNKTASTTNLVLSGAVFGGSSTNVFTILQGIAIPINVAPYINELPTLIAGQNTLSSKVSFGAFVVDLNSPQVIGIDTSVSIKDVTLPAQIELSYVGANVAIGQVPLAELRIPKFSMTPSNGDLDISLHLDLALQESQALTQTVSGLAQTILAGKSLDTTSLVISGAVFGGSSTKVFTFLEGVKIPLDVTSYLNQAIASFGQDSTSSLLSSITVSDLVVDLNAPQVIGIDAAVLVKNVTLPAEIKLNYVGANVAIESVPLAQVSVPHAISGLVSAVLANETLSETDLIISGVTFGASSTNFFTILEGVTIPVNIATYIAKIGNTLTSAGSSLSSIGLSDLAINLNKAPTIGIDADVAIHDLTLPAMLNVGYVGLTIAVNDVSLADVSIPKIQLGTSGTDLTIATHVDVTLEDTDASQTVVAGLVDNIIAGQTSQGTIVISGIAFGPSKSNVYTILEGVQVPIPISKVLSLVSTTSTSTSTTSILNNLSLQSADINMKNPPSIGADIVVALTGYQFDAQLLLDYVSISAFLDDTSLATISVPDITLTSSDNKVALSVQSLINLDSSSAIQTKVAAIAAEVMGSSGSQNVSLVISNIAFGGSASSTFHILDKVKISIPLASYIQELTSAVSSLTSSSSTSAFSISKLDIGAPDANDLTVALSASISGIGSKISVEMPYIGVQVSVGDTGFVYPTINNFQLSNGNIALTLDLAFQSGASKIVSSLSDPVSELLFGTLGTVSGSIVINSVVFGASASQSFDIASKIGLEIGLNSVFQAAKTFLSSSSSLSFSDANTVMTTTGIQTTISISGASLGSLPLKVDFPISLSCLYNGDAFIDIETTSMSLTASPWAIGIKADVIEPEFGTAMSAIIPNTLEWKNILEGVTIGKLALGACTVLSELVITPPSITLWSPITIPLNKLTPHLSPLGMDFAISFVNGGPLQLDIGSIDIMVTKGTTQILEIQNIGGPLQLYGSSQNGGQNLFSMNVALKFNILELITVIPSLLNPGTSYSFSFSTTSSSGDTMPWLQDALNGVPDSIYSNLLPILANALSNVKFTI